MEWVDTVIQLINGVGFPIAACLFMGWFIVWDKKERRKQHAEQQERQEAVIAKLEEAVNSNTAVIQQLVERMEKTG